MQFRLSQMVKNALEQPTLKQLSAQGDQVEETSALVKYTVSHLLWAFSRSRSMTPTELLAFMKRSPTLFRSSSKIDNLLVKVEILRNELHYRGFDTSFSGDTKDVIRYAQDLFGYLRNIFWWVCLNFQTLKSLFFRRCEISDVSKLSKALKPMFLYEGVVALSVCSLLKVGSLNCHAGSNAPLAFANYDQVMVAVPPFHLVFWVHASFFQKIFSQKSSSWTKKTKWQGGMMVANTNFILHCLYVD